MGANNLYGQSMMQLLSIEILDCVNPKSFHLDSYPDDSSIGCFLEVDLDYSDKLHGLHDNCLLAAEKIKVTKKTLLNINHKS